MSLIDFPDPRLATFDGIVAVGGKLTPENLLRAYRAGIFPWPIDRWLPWFCPDERAILEFKDLHFSRSLRKAQRNAGFRFTIDAAFPQVIHNCATVARAHEPGTWIDREIIRAYTELHAVGRAHSVETWRGNQLVGGLYGVDAGGAFAGESMFYLEPNASKLALLHLIEHLAARGAEWIDAQVMTPHMLALGAREIPRVEFLDKLAQTQARGLRLFD
ncbi:MAG: leucyl/phenylalanyl-tRNA--protein transferase [Pyrinomonadaceae bacterium]